MADRIPFKQNEYGSGCLRGIFSYFYKRVLTDKVSSSILTLKVA